MNLLCAVLVTLLFPGSVEAPGNLLFTGSTAEVLVLAEETEESSETEDSGFLVDGDLDSTNADTIKECSTGYAALENVLIVLLFIISIVGVVLYVLVRKRKKGFGCDEYKSEKL